MARAEPDEDEILYGRTPLGQLVYDLGFTKLGDKYLARKHGLPIQKIRDCRAAFERGWNSKKKSRRRS